MDTRIYLGLTDRAAQRGWGASRGLPQKNKMEYIANISSNTLPECMILPFLRSQISKFSCRLMPPGLPDDLRYYNFKGH
jgi:hypothetical protein